MKNTPQFLAYKDFLPSLKKLMQKGGAYGRAGRTVEAAWGRANSKGAYSYDEVFEGIPLTNRGENRISNCVKYDLAQYSRLVTTYSKDICIFLFAGDHDAVDGWLDKNVGLNFIAKKIADTFSVEPVFVSNTAPDTNRIINSATDWMSSGPVVDLLSKECRDQLLSPLSGSAKRKISAIESHSSEDEVLDAVAHIDDEELGDALLDVLLALRSSDLNKAKNRIDLYLKKAVTASSLTPEEVKKVISSESTVRVEDVDPVLFSHFLRNADFKEWMLYLHPAQREYVNRNFNGPARLAGVSGSGKTCVVIHRALRLANEPGNKLVLILTLNDALAVLIKELILAENGGDLPANISVKSVFEMCKEQLVRLNPGMEEYYVKTTVQKNGYAIVEHIDEIWDEYFNCENNNTDADVMFDVVRTLLVRGVFPKDYLRQEFDYIRSAFSPTERGDYLQMERVGRVIALEQRYREMLLEGLDGWERKMNAVGAIDDIGVVTALYDYLDRLTPIYDHVLVDEVQDLGTLELKIIRHLTRFGENDLFLSGDAAQTVHTKHFDQKSSGIDLPSARWIRLSQNYRNSRQILTAAHAVLTRSFEKIPAGTVDLEIIRPEYANFSSAKPLLLKAESLEEEMRMALSYVESFLLGEVKRKACVVICGYSQVAVELLGRALSLPVLCGVTQIDASDLFLSDLEQTKGFEFDLVVVVNCGDAVIPHPELPENESFRELCRLYVALTRAKTELIVSSHTAPSRFITVAQDDCFNVGTWAEHIDCKLAPLQVQWPSPMLQKVGRTESWTVKGRDFLRLRDAVGLSTTVQEEILVHVTGSARTQTGPGGTRKQVEWRDFSSFYRAMKDPKNRGGVLSEVAWEEIRSKMEYAIGQRVADTDTTRESASGRGNERNATESVVEPVVVSKEEVVHRSHVILAYSQEQITAHVIASFMAVQGVSKLEDLEVGFGMDKALIDFLIPRTVLREWVIKAKLRDLKTDSTRVALTKAGRDHCLSRSIITTSVGPWSRPAGMTSISEQSVIDSLAKIFSGCSGHDGEKFYRRVV
ncbi:3'-5' exonuclease [Achromobacter sp. MFA1 R4]|uniref:3'-5' exonuclease n=1 Tax=Achromobacter sp. MFA1 R4 TaxID=1881016 RepID=UPI0009539B17|nr:3'-5' exonuclease [Achromobacter sp. MFA1 R4]SIT31705.1 UvrD-like helicase C-terminal domain-containing protein [Achromobacter sp. MFA1 R4]